MTLNVRTFALFGLAAACVISSCKTQQIAQGETVVITERVTVVDTIVLTDTVTITKDRLRVRLLKLPGDTVRVEAECQPDTVRVQTTTIVTNEKELQRSKRWVSSLFLLALVLLIIILLRR